MPTLVFMPWVSLADRATIGDFELLPVNLRPDHDVRPLPAATDEVRRVLNAYRAPHGSPVASATVVQRRGGALTAELAENEIDDFFLLNEAVAFAGLAGRVFFGHEYCNRDSFQLIAQRFKPDASGVALVSRRRDGSTTNFLPGEMHVVRREAHVVELRNIRLDEELASDVLSAMTQDEHFERAIRLFNEANTDRSTTSQSQELISVVSALQRLLQVSGGGAKETREALLQEMASVPVAEVRSSKPGVLKKLEEGRKGLRDVWVEDLYALRGNVGHGHAMHRRPSLWTAHEHLLLTAFLFPLLVKKRLASRKVRELTDDEGDDLHAFDHLLSAGVELVAPDQVIDGMAVNYQWQRFLREGQDEGRRARVLRELDQLDGTV